MLCLVFEGQSHSAVQPHPKSWSGVMCATTQGPGCSLSSPQSQWHPCLGYSADLLVSVSS